MDKMLPTLGEKQFQVSTCHLPMRMKEIYVFEAFAY